MIKPSPPKKPALILRLKWVFSCTPASAARKAVFCTTISAPGAIGTARIRPGKLLAKAISPSPPRQV